MCVYIVVDSISSLEKPVVVLRIVKIQCCAVNLKEKMKNSIKLSLTPSFSPRK